MPNRSLNASTAPHEITIRRAIRWKEAQEQMLWLVSPENDCTGQFVNGKRNVYGIEYVWYRFTDPNTAFRFKLQFS
ncbi:MAG: hypothetical protein EOP83_06910 [Verrucomicrobiaceae bacterium]|nr:MAG: hypothetical protein EOP83_06910 [Verrucomicrobiaceae bacterium]